MADRREVSVDLVSRLKPKGFKDLEKQTKKSSKTLEKFGKRLTAALGVGALTKALTKSVLAFAENEKAVKRLQLELDNLNLGFASILANDFIRKLSLATGITDDELNPALQKLIRTTYTLTDAQKLLGLAVDITKQTGLDLSTVTNALSRAFLGDTKALARLNIGYTAASLKGKEFNEILDELQKKFGGAAAKSQDTYATAIDRIKVAFDEAREALGEGFIKGLEQSGLTVDEFIPKIIALGETIGTALGKAAGAISTIDKKFEELAKNPIIKTLLRLYGLLDKKSAAQEAEELAVAAKQAQDAARKKAEADIAAVKAAKELAAQEEINRKRRAAELARLKAAEKKKASEQKRSAELERLRNAISYKFDIDAINQQAALRRNISAEDKDRLLQLIALKITDYQTDEEAIKTLTAATKGRYTEAMALEQMLQILKVAGYATDINAIKTLEKLDPKITFKDNLDDVIAKLKKVIEGKYTINIDVNMPKIVVPDKGAPYVAPDRSTPSGAGGFGSGASGGGVMPINPRGGGFTFIPEGIGPGAFEKPGMIVEGFDNKLTNPQLNFTAVGGGVFETRATTGGGLPSFLDYLDATPGSAGFGGRLPFGVSRESITVNVNAAGSIISQNDLVAAVTDAVYQTQRTGNPLLLTEV